MRLLSVNSDAKTIKGLKRGWQTAILYLAPHTLAGGPNLCPHSTPGCRFSCLFSAGRGAFPQVESARIERTKLFLEQPDKFIQMLGDDLEDFLWNCQKKKLKPCARLNGTSDQFLLARRMAANFPSIQFYDYTKIPMPWKRETSNYHLTFSMSELNQFACIDALEHGINVAVVGKEPPFWSRVHNKFNKPLVINGDENDLRFLDPRPAIVLLKPKGKAKQDVTGFVA